MRNWQKTKSRKWRCNISQKIKGARKLVANIYLIYPLPFEGWPKPCVRLESSLSETRVALFILFFFSGHYHNVKVLDPHSPTFHILLLPVCTTLFIYFERRGVVIKNDNFMWTELLQSRLWIQFLNIWVVGFSPFTDRIKAATIS